MYQAMNQMMVEQVEAAAVVVRQAIAAAAPVVAAAGTSAADGMRRSIATWAISTRRKRLSRHVDCAGAVSAAAAAAAVWFR